MRNRLKGILKWKSSRDARRNVDRSDGPNVRLSVGRTNIESTPYQQGLAASLAPPSAPPILEGDNFGLTLLYEPEQPDESQVDIIFVHGLTGNAFNTWYHRDKKLHWPSTLLRENIPLARIFIFGYDANVASFWGGASQNRLANHAENLVGHLAGVREETQKEGQKIIFVAHSLGGLVVERAIQISEANAEQHLRQIERSTIGILFLGTPHSGSDFAPFSKAVGTVLGLAGKRVNTDILDSLRRDSQVLLDVEDWFGQWRRRRSENTNPVQITTFFEEMGLPIVGKVVEESQVKIPGYSSYGIRSNHMDMPKFATFHDPGYKAVRREIQRWIRRVDEVEPESNKRIDKVLTSLNRCPYEDRKNVNPQRIEGTCEWFRNHKQFKQWDEGSTSGLLWVSADPGCGKSVLSRYLVDNELKSPQRTVCYFFFKDGFPDQQSASVALCSLLRQLFLSQRHLLGGKTLASIENERSTLYSSFNQLWDILLHVAKDNSFGETVCVLDALDECWRSDFEQLSTELVRFYMKKPGTKLKFLLLSRPYDHIQWNFQTLKNSMPTIHLSGESEEEMEDIVKEIDLVVKHRIATIGAKRRLRPEECDHLQSLMTAVPNRTYLWATLTLDVVENMHGFTRGNVIRTIKKLPETVDQAYTSILARGSDIPKALRALRCVATARRPLWVKEVMVMTAVEEHHASFDDLEEELEAEERFQTTLRNLCGLCLVVIGGKVYFLHQTVREFLVSSEQESNCEIQPSILEYDPTLWKHALDQTTSHRVLAQACIWYLLLPVPPIPGVSSQRGFDGYSLEYWDHHFRESATEGRDILMLSAIKLLDPAGSWWRIEASSRRKNAHHSNFPNALLSATVHNLPTVVEFLLQETEGIDVNATDAELNRSSLAWAADRALRSIVVMLTKHQQTNVNIKDCNGNTPLILAVYDSEGGMPDTTIVYSLLRHEQLDFYARNKKGQSALDVAQQWPAIEFFDEIDSAFSSLLKSRLEAIRAHWYTRLRD